MKVNYKKDLIMGKSTIREVLKHRTNILKKIFTCSKDDSLIKDILKKNIRIEYLSKNKLEHLVGSVSHQSFVGEIEKRKYLDIKECKNFKTIVMLDNICDPHNMGAILRAAECFKVDCVVFSKNRGVDITPTVSKVSCGASELVSLVKISNLQDGISKFKKMGFTILAASNEEKSMDITKMDFFEKFVVILGSEERGIKSLYKKLADFLVKIPLLGKIDSLNVSQAAAVILYFLNNRPC
ncbi:MAG: hypothetical protein AMS24_03545 [Chlamydiae bacterium SM23_39]|nr:MAG: hypothetical protein AMS24_03545 [Chlamydiae bacterium SM23_39]